MTLMLKSHGSAALVLLLSMASTPSYAATPQAGTAPGVVFANFRTLMGAYGNTVAGYKRDIQNAQAAGIDGFALDMEGYQTPELIVIQQEEVANLFRAAADLGTGFKLFFDLDCHVGGYDAACLDAARQLVAVYSSHPNYLYYQDRPLFTGWGSTIDSTKGSSDDVFWTQVLANIAATNTNILFIPTFFNWKVFPPSQAYLNTETWFTNGFLNGKVQGLMNWGQLVPSIAVLNNDVYAAVAKKHNLAFASSVESWHSPIRFLSEQKIAPKSIMVSVEFNGGEGMSSIWQEIITHLKSPLVYLVTWNDYTESYISPASQADLTAASAAQKTRWQVTGDYLYTHAAYTELNKYFISWYKTGRRPVWPDAMYVFYRTAPMSTIAAKAPAGTQIDWNTQNGINPTLDDVYVTTILTAPATLTVNTGGKATNLKVAAGLVHTRVPFSVGSQKFTLSRGIASLIEITGKNIVSKQDYYYNVNPVSYYGYSTRK